MTNQIRMFAIMVALTGTTACERSTDPGPTGSPGPTAVTCADGPQLRQRADDERLQISEMASDQGKIIGGSRASFYMSLAIIADLKCKDTSADADANTALSVALSAARDAEGAGTFYETALHWIEAGIAANQAIAALIGQLSASSERSAQLPAALSTFGKNASFTMNGALITLVDGVSTRRWRAPLPWPRPATWAGRQRET